MVSKPDDHFFKAPCSLCPAFGSISWATLLKRMKILRQTFDVHVRQAHGHDRLQAKEILKAERDVGCHPNYDRETKRRESELPDPR